MTGIQSRGELDAWHRSPDPWGYEDSPDDARRKAMLLSAIPPRDYAAALDIGCGQGFVTRDLPGRRVCGVDISAEAVGHAHRFASDRVSFETGDIFTLGDQLEGHFDLIVITGVLYRQYIGAASTLVYQIIDGLLAPDGILISVHIDEWYVARFPYTVLTQYAYPYREYFHRLEVYAR